MFFADFTANCNRLPSEVSQVKTQAFVMMFMTHFSLELRFRVVSVAISFTLSSCHKEY